MTRDLRHDDIKHLWHPYTDIADFEANEPPVIERAEGVYLYEKGGRALLDGIASWWCVNLGHSHPRLVERLREQAGKLQHSIIAGLSHPLAVELAAKLADITPEGLEHSFFAGDGASAVEAALKIAIQYRANTGDSRRTRFICLEDGYHGDTLGAVGVGFIPAFHEPFRDVVREAYRAASPHCAKCPCGKEVESCGIECFASIEKLVREHYAETTAIIVEPLCQGAAGVRVYPGEYLRRLRALCNEYDLLLIADEIAVGYGRTGAMFACGRAGIAPDIMTVGKGLTGGYLPMSAAIVTGRIYDSFRDGHTFYHGHTFCGNPITSALALEVLAIYSEEGIPETCAPRQRQLETGMREVGDALEEARVLTLGMIGAAHLGEGSGGAERAKLIARRALDLGLFIRPLGESVYLWPPLMVSEAELADMLSILKQAVAETAV